MSGWVFVRKKCRKASIEISAESPGFAHVLSSAIYLDKKGPKERPSGTLRQEHFFSVSYGPLRRFSGGSKDKENLEKSNPELSPHLSLFGEDVALTECLTTYFPKIQFIVTTHSAIICQAAENGSIYRLATPGSDQESGKVEGIDRARLIYGSIVEAYDTELFSSKNKKGNAPFDKIKVSLDRMCSGGRRCHYCEDSAANDIEHFYPKSFYPEHCFRWANYLYSCEQCNRIYKNNRFEIFKENGNEIVDLVALRKETGIVVPPSGRPLLLDPRSDVPTEFIKPDLLTLLYVPTAPADTDAYRRGKYTIKLLGLNRRPVLIDARMEAYDSYVARLDRYNNRKATAPADFPGSFERNPVSPMN